MDELIPPKTIAVIDIGTNAIRLVIAEAFQDGKIQIIERLTRGVWLGRDTFQRGVLGSETMRAAIEILSIFKKYLVQFSVTEVRVLATSAVREAANADFFVERVRLATKLEVEIIDPAEEVQLTVSAVHELVGDELKKTHKPVLLADVGGGSTLLTILQNGTVINSQSFNFGSVLLREMYTAEDKTSVQTKELMLHAIDENFSSAESYFPLHDNELFIATGGDARFAARQISTETVFGCLSVIRREDLKELVDQCAKYDPQRLCREFEIPFDEAETLVPALLTYQELLRRTKAETLLVSTVSMRDGVLQSMAREVWGREDTLYQADVLDAAKALALKYHLDVKHAERTAALAERIFDELQAEHGMEARCRLILSVAAILQHSGRFVNNRAFYKHSYYLIMNSEIFGLQRTDLQLVAYTARYSRRSGPKADHIQFMSLPRQSRLAVSKLTSLLRIADALNHGESPAPDRIRFERDGDELILHLPPLEGFLLKQRVLQSEGKMFEDVFGIRVSLEC